MYTETVDRAPGFDPAAETQEHIALGIVHRAVTGKVLQYHRCEEVQNNEAAKDLFGMETETETSSGTSHHSGHELWHPNTCTGMHYKCSRTSKHS